MCLELFIGTIHEELPRRMTSKFREVEKVIVPIHELLRDRLRQ